MRYQPQGPFRLAQANPLTRGLVRAINAGSRNARPIGNAALLARPSGIGFTAPNTGDAWIASDTALASAWPNWTILVMLSGYSPNVNVGGLALYAERPNDTQIVKIALTGKNGVNTAQLVVRDLSNSLILSDGTADVRSDFGKPRVLVATRRASNDHRLFVDGVQDIASGASITGAFGQTNARIGGDAFDAGGFLGGTACVPLVLVWNRPLSDAEIKQISANPWQVLDTSSSANAYAAAIASAGGVTNAQVAPASGALVLTGYAPTVGQTAARLVTPGAGALALTGYAPTVSQSSALQANPGPAALVLAGHAPAVAQSALRIVSPGAAALSFTGYTPTVSQRAGVTPNIYAFTIMDAAPLYRTADLGPDALNLTGPLL